jgi:hypothetical protein
MTPVERAIRSREAAIIKLTRQRDRFRRDAEEKIAKLDRRIAERRIILEAIQAGRLSLEK